MKRFRLHRLTLAALFTLPLLVAFPPPVTGQIPVTDGANLAARLLEYAMQGLQLAEEVESVTNLAHQIQQLDTQIEHLRDEAMGHIGALTSTFQQLTSDPVQLFRSVGVSWGQDLLGSGDLLHALLNMDGGSLVNHLTLELDAADAVREADLLALFADDPERAERAVDTWTARRQRGDRIRAGDYAAAEAAGRLAQALDDAQQKLGGLRGQGNVSNTALQQADLASQLMDAEINVALAQLLAYESQKSTLVQQEQELQARERLERWVNYETDWRIDFRRIRAAEDGRREVYRAALLLPVRHGG